MIEPTEPSDAETLPVESAASIRRTFMILTFVAGCVCLPPRQWISAGILGVITGLQWWRHSVLTQRELSQRPKPSAPSATSSSADGPSSSPISDVARPPTSEEPSARSLDGEPKSAPRDSSG